MEMTSVTKLPRRIFTFSQANLKQAIGYNHTGARVLLSVNFANYVDHEMSTRRGVHHPIWSSGDEITPKFREWLGENIVPVVSSTRSTLRFIGTGSLTDDMVEILGE
jgi:hypothetical protein